MANKKLLIIFDLNETLLLLRRTKKAILTGTESLYENIKFDEELSPYKVRYRAGRPQFLESMFTINPEAFDIAIWSSLNSEDTQLITSNYFGRYYRNLLFVAPTRREDYQGKAGRENFAPIPIQRDLSQIFLKFPQYEQSNTFVISNYKNLVSKYNYNDIVVPRYNPSALSHSFSTDPGVAAIMKYLVGVKVFMKAKNIDDARTIVSVKSISKMFDKVAHNVFSPKENG